MVEMAHEALGLVEEEHAFDVAARAEGEDWACRGPRDRSATAASASARGAGGRRPRWRRREMNPETFFVKTRSLP